MNSVERVLADEIARLMDRLASSVPDGAVNDVRATEPRLRARLDQTEAQLAAARAALVENYARWLRAIDDVENLWAVAAFRAGADEPEKKAA